MRLADIVANVYHPKDKLAVGISERARPGFVRWALWLPADPVDVTDGDWLTIDAESPT